LSRFALDAVTATLDDGVETILKYRRPRCHSEMSRGDWGQ